MKEGFANERTVGTNSDDRNGTSNWETEDGRRPCLLLRLHEIRDQTLAAAQDCKEETRSDIEDVGSVTNLNGDQPEATRRKDGDEISVVYRQIGQCEATSFFKINLASGYDAGNELLIRFFCDGSC